MKYTIFIFTKRISLNSLNIEIIILLEFYLDFKIK